MAPPFEWSYLGDVFDAFATLGRMTFTLKSDIGNQPNSGSRDQRDAFTDLTGAQEALLGKLHVITGWAAAKSAVPVIEVQSGSQTLEGGLVPSNAPDIGALYPGLQSVRFSLSFECPAEDCSVKVSSPDATDVFPVSTLVAGRPVDDDDVKVMFDTAGTAQRFPVTASHMRLKQRIVRAISRVYRITMPLASALALAGFVTATILRRGSGLALYTLAAASLAAIACRLVLLAYLDATSIPSANTLYASPATPFVIVFVVTGIYAGCAALAGYRRKPVTGS